MTVESNQPACLQDRVAIVERVVVVGVKEAAARSLGQRLAHGLRAALAAGRRVAILHRVGGRRRRKRWRR